MSVPEIVRERLTDEEPSARVPLGGDDELLVTPSRTLIYRAEGLLSGESVEEYGHDAERVSISEGRRKSTIRLDHGIDGTSEFTIPSKFMDEALEPVLGGVLRAADVIDGGESILHIHRLGELTLLITDARVIKHIGGDLWDAEEFEEFEYENVTGLEVEEGDVSSQIVIEVDRRPQWIKTPAAEVRRIREHIQQPLLAYHEVSSYPEFQRLVDPDDEQVETIKDLEATVTASVDQQPATHEETEEEEVAAEPEAEAEDTQPEEDTESIESTDLETVEVEETDGETTGQPVDVAREVANLRVAVERQNELLDAHQRTIERLIDSLTRD